MGFEVRECTGPPHFIPVVGFYSERAIPLCTWRSFSKYPFSAYNLTCRSVNGALETKASMWLLFSTAGHYLASATDEMTWLLGTKSAVKLPSATQSIIWPTPNLRIRHWCHKQKKFPYHYHCPPDPVDCVCVSLCPSVYGLTSVLVCSICVCVYVHVCVCVCVCEWLK